MAHLEDAIYSRLSGYAGLTALTSTRIYPMRAPAEAAYPHVVYQRISTERVSAMGVDTGISIPRLQVTTWAATPKSAKDVKEQVRKALQRWRGTAAGVVILESQIVGEIDLVDEEQAIPGAGQPGVYGVALDIRIPHREA